MESAFVRSWHNTSTISSLALVLLLLCSAMIILRDKNKIFLPLLVVICFVSDAQRVIVFGLDFSFFRILILILLLKASFEFENFKIHLNFIDKIFVFWAISWFLSFVILWGTLSAFVNQLGLLYDRLGWYFIFRIFIKDFADIKSFVKGLVLLSLPVAFFLLVEKQTGRNFFSIFGGVPEFTLIRGGKLRAQGAFSHPILAGCFFATTLPIMFSLWYQESKDKKYCFIGVLTTTFIVFACASSTPVGVYMVVILGWLIYFFRHHLKNMVWAFSGMLVLLIFVMDAPVWHLISRVDFAGGSTGWHRYNLINQMVSRVSEWWLFGVKSTAHWGWFLHDTANEYVNAGVRGGILTLSLFILMLGFSFVSIYKLSMLEKLTKAQRIFSWGIFVSLLAYCASFMAVSLFGQNIVLWFMTLASISSLYNTHLVTKIDSELNQLEVKYEKV